MTFVCRQLRFFTYTLSIVPGTYVPYLTRYSRTVFRRNSEELPFAQYSTIAVRNTYRKVNTEELQYKYLYQVRDVKQNFLMDVRHC